MRDFVNAIGRMTRDLPKAAEAVRDAAMKIIDATHLLPPLEPRFIIASPWPGYGDMSGEARQIARELVIATVDDDLGLPEPFFDAEEDAQRVIDALALRHPGRVFSIVSSRGWK